MCTRLLDKKNTNGFFFNSDQLAQLPDATKILLANSAARFRKLTPVVAGLFASPFATLLHLPNCTELDPLDLTAILDKCLSPDLVHLHLGLCGRGLTDTTAMSFSRVDGRVVGLASLRSLTLTGAYKLTDTGLTNMLHDLPSLSELNLVDCTRAVTPSILECLPQKLPQLRVLDLTGSNNIHDDGLRTWLTSLPQETTRLETLRLARVTAVNDGVLAALPSSLHSLDLSRCIKLTEIGLATHLVHLINLRSLVLDHVTKGVTDMVLGSLFAHLAQLEELSLVWCNRLSSAGIQNAFSRRKCRLKSLNLNHVTALDDLCLAALATEDSLEILDISWCSALSTDAVGHLIDRCSSLRRLNAWGCSQRILTKSLRYGHTNSKLELCPDV